MTLKSGRNLRISGSYAILVVAMLMARVFAMLGKKRKVYMSLDPPINTLENLLSDEKLNEIIYKLDEYAQLYSRYEYGLPVILSETMTGMREIIRNVLIKR